MNVSLRLGRCLLVSRIRYSISSRIVLAVLGLGGASAAAQQFVPAAGPLDVGSANMCPAGSSSPSPCSQTGTATFSYSLTESISSLNISVLTQGAAGLDFSDARTGTCKSLALSSGSTGTCTVNVIFAPTHPGVRLGAIELIDQNGTVVGTELLSGTGTGPQIAFPNNAAVQQIGSGFIQPGGIAVDALGDVFVGETGTSPGKIMEIMAAGGQVSSTSTISQIVAGYGFSAPFGLALDGNGDLFVADSDRGVDEIVAVNGKLSGSPIVIGLNQVALYGATGVAVDRNGNVFVAESSNGKIMEVLATNGVVSNSSQVIQVGSGFTAPYGLAVASNGDLLVADAGASSVYDITPAGGVFSSSSTLVQVGGGFNLPGDVVLDAAGDLYVTNISSSGGAILEVQSADGVVSSSSNVLTLDGGFTQPKDLAIDASGNIFVADIGNGNVEEIPVATPPSLSFANTNVFDGDSSDSPKTVMVANNGNANLTFPPPTSGNNPSAALANDFTLNSSVGTACPQLDTSSSAYILVEGAFCTLSINFAPQDLGTDTGSLVLLDNSLNAQPSSYTTQTISFSGTGEGVTTSTQANNAAAIYSTSAQSVALSATVIGGSSTIASGTVTFTILQGSTTVGAPVSASVSGGSVGVAYTLPAGLATGAYTIQATYNGGNGLASSSDSSHQLTISAASTTTAASNVSATYSSGSQIISLSATVTSAATTVNGGTVTFSVFNGGTQIGSSTSGTVSNGTVIANYNLAAGEPTGTYSIVANFSDAGGNFTSSSDSTHTLTISPAATITAASDASVIYNPNGQTVTLNATLTSASGVVNGGTVTFAVLQGTTPIGTTTAGTVSGGVASVNYLLPGTAAVGEYTIQAVYSGLSGIFDGSSDTTHSLTINPVPAYVVSVSTDDASGVAGDCVDSNTGKSSTGSTNNSNCTLRDALAAANAGGANITFDSTAFASAQTITLSNGTLNIPSNTTIQGLTTGTGAALNNLVTVSGGGSSSDFSVFTVASGVTGAIIENLTITNGYSTTGGAGINNSGGLTLSASTVSGNQATSNSAGGGVANSGSLTVMGSTFVNNVSTSFDGGGVYNAGTLVLTNSTFEGNSALTGGGLLNNSGGTATLLASTFSSNTAGNGGGGGIFNAGTLTANNTIVAGNSAGSNGYADIYNVAAYNAGGDIAGTSNSATSQIVIALTPLGNHGGPTSTMLPLPGSPAICAGSYSSAQTAGITADQRGVTFGSTGAGGYCSSGSVDVGAVQTDYALSFTTPVTNVPLGVAMTPAPAVTLNESGIPFTVAAVTIPLTLASSPAGATLSGGSASTAAGVASYSSLSVNQAGTNDQLTATLALNTSPAVSISATSGDFDVSQATLVLSFTPSPNLQTYGTAITSGSLDATASYNSSNVAGTFAYTTTVNGNIVTLTPGTTVLPVGTYTITANFTPSDTTDYKTASLTAAYSVSAAAVTASLTASNKAYNGTTTATITGCTLTGVLSADAGNVSCSASSASFATKNVGTGITVTATGIALGGSAAGNYSLSTTTATTTANITAAPLTITAATNTKVYDSTTSAAAVPTVGTGQLQGSDTVTGLAEAYATASAGTGKMLNVSAFTINDGNNGNNYQVTTVANSTGVINPAAVTATISVGNKTYNGTTAATITGCTLTGVLPADAANVTCSASSASFATKNVGTAITVTATGVSLSGSAAGNYSLASTTATAAANITAAPLTITAATNTKVYDSTTSAAAVPTVGAGQLQGADTVTSLAETYATASAGTGKTLNVSAYAINDGNNGNNYQVTTVANTTGVINPATVTASITVGNKTYNGTTVATIAGCTLTGVLPSDAGNVTCSAASANFASKNVGTGITVTATGFSLSGTAAGNYMLSTTTATATANIAAAPLTITAATNTKVYDSTTSAAAVPTIGAGQLQGSDTVTGLAETYATASAGTGKTLNVSAFTINDGNNGNNYLVTAVANTTGVINPAAVTATITASNKTYNGTTSATITGCTLTGILPADAGNVTCSATSANFATKNVGTGITVTATGIALSGSAAGNYSLSTTATTTANITAVPLTITAAANTKVYDSTTSAAALPTLGTGQLQGADTVTGLAETYATASAGTGKTLNVSAYTINDGNNGNNYQVTTVANNTGVINSATVTASVTASDKTYNGTTTATITGCTLTGVLSADAGNVTCSASGATFATSGGGNSIVVTATGIALGGSAAGNYTLSSTTATTTANISQATLTITASSGSFVYGSAAPVITPSYLGFVGTDSASSLTAAPTCSTTATSTSSVGSYTSTCSGAADANYAISYVAGRVSVTQAALVVAAGNTSTPYGTVPTVNPSYSGFVAGNTGASLTLPPSCSSTVTASSPAGTYTGANTCAGAVDSNYSISYVPGTATVTQAAQTINFTQPSSPVTFGVVPINLSATASSGLSVAFSVVSGLGSISGSTLIVTGPGTILVAANQSGNSNYAAAPQVTRSVTVNGATLIVTASNATKVYGTANPTFTGTVTGQQNGDTFTESFATTATISSLVGTYSIVPSVAGANLAAYTQSVTDGTLTVTQAASATTVSVSGASVVPGQSVTLIAAVASTTSGTPTGTVNFYDNGTLLNSAPAALNAGVTSFATTALAPGMPHIITAAYSGDVNFTGSSSTPGASTTVTVGPLDFALTLIGPADLTVAPGKSISYQLQVTPDYGSYPGTVEFAVSGLPSGAAAAFSPSTIAANGGQQTITVTITTAPAMATNRDQPTSGSRRLAPFALAFVLLVGAGKLRKRGRVLRGLLCVLVLASAGLAATGLSGCGGSSLVQPPETYTVTLTATAANLQHTSVVNLTVQ